jgi:hypothetical protein
MPAAAGDALYAMELVLSLEKLNFQKLRHLHDVAEKHGDSQMCDFVGELAPISVWRTGGWRPWAASHQQDERGSRGLALLSQGHVLLPAAAWRCAAAGLKSCSGRGYGLAGPKQPATQEPIAPTGWLRGRTLAAPRLPCVCCRGVPAGGPGPVCEAGGRVCEPTEEGGQGERSCGLSAALLSASRTMDGAFWQ